MRSQPRVPPERAHESRDVRVLGRHAVVLRQPDADSVADGSARHGAAVCAHERRRHAAGCRWHVDARVHDRHAADVRAPTRVATPAVEHSERLDQRLQRQRLWQHSRLRDRGALHAPQRVDHGRRHDGGRVQDGGPAQVHAQVGLLPRRRGEPCGAAALCARLAAVEELDARGQAPSLQQPAGGHAARAAVRLLQHYALARARHRGHVARHAATPRGLDSGRVRRHDRHATAPGDRRRPVVRRHVAAGRLPRRHGEPQQ